MARKGTLEMLIPRLGAAVALIGVVGCSDLDPETDTAETVNLLSRPLPENWRCLDIEPPRVMPSKPMISYTGFVPDYRTQLPVPFTARACRIQDSACPVGVAEGSLVMDPSLPFTGFTVSVPAEPEPFEGFMRLTAPDYLPFDYYIGGPLVEDTRATQPHSMVSLTSAGEFLVGLGANPLESFGLGLLAVHIFDCNRDPAPGVKLILPDAATQPALARAQAFATNGRIPLPDLPTDSEGIAGFINLPNVNLRVEAEVLGRRFGLRSFPIRSGVLTAGTIRPNYVVGY